jgi:formamidopyrimidine-DNA glycosylase
LSETFTEEYFNNLFSEVPQDKRVSAKYFIVSEPGFFGVGNGCLQDILYRARIHPRRQVLDLSIEERHKLYQAVTYTLKQMAEQCGRDSERDLYNQPGGYARLLHSKSVGKPCRNCGTPIEKEQYLGGAVYFCPTCQPL